MQKECSKCKSVKSVSEFYLNRDSADGKRSTCKRCSNAVVANWASRNRGKQRAYSRRSYHRDVERSRVLNNQRRNKNLIHRRSRDRERRRENPEWARLRDKRNNAKKRSTVGGRIEDNLRRALNKWLHRRGATKAGRITKLIGCSMNSFRMYLETRFESGMSWNNYGSQNGCWSIDHIIPVSLFDLTNPDHQRYCFHFSNMRPMWHIENMKKSNHITEDRQIELPIAGL